MKKVLVTNSFAQFSPKPVELLKGNGFEVVKIKEHILSDENAVLSYIDDNVVAIVNGLEPVSEITYQAARGLKIITKHGIGLDNIDLEGAKKHGIAIANTPGANRNGVADLAFGLMLSLARHIPQAAASMKKREWKGFFGSSVYGRTLGIVGMGAIGREMALRAEGFGMTILGYDPFWNESFAKEHHVERCELNDLLRRSDFVTLHSPLLPATVKMIGKEQLEMMKPTAYLVNTARGELIDEAALIEAMKANKIAGAALDAHVKEPVDKDNPLLDMENVILTPHIAFYTDEAMNSTSLFAAENIVRYFAGNVVIDGKKPAWLVVSPE